MGTQPTLAERDLRFKRLRQAMEQANLDLLLIAGKGHGWTGRGYFRWLTDFHLWGHDGMILFPLEGEPLLSLTSSGVGNRIAAQGWITDTVADWYITPKIVDEIKRRGLDKSRIGVAGHEFIIGAGAFKRIEEGLDQAEIIPADDLMNRVRAIRSPLQIQQYKELWAMSKAAMERFVTHLEPGMTEKEASMESVRYIHQHGARDYLIFFNGNVPSDRLVQLEDILAYHMEICNESGHYNELTVTLAYRDPTPDELRIMETELAVYEDIRKAAKPGARLGDLFAMFEQALVDAGFELNEEPKHHFEFHGQGMDWIEWPTMAPNDPIGHDVEIEEGMVLNYHPAANIKPTAEVRQKTGINDHILITKDGAVRLSGDWDMRWRLV